MLRLFLPWLVQVSDVPGMGVDNAAMNKARYAEGAGHVSNGELRLC